MNLRLSQEYYHYLLSLPKVISWDIKINFLLLWYLMKEISKEWELWESEGYLYIYITEELHSFHKWSSVKLLSIWYFLDFTLRLARRLTLDLWLVKDNRFLNPKSSYERILTAPPCRLTLLSFYRWLQMAAVSYRS